MKVRENCSAGRLEEQRKHGRLRIDDESTLAAVDLILAGLHWSLIGKPSMFRERVITLVNDLKAHAAMGHASSCCLRKSLRSLLSISIEIDSLVQLLGAKEVFIEIVGISLFYRKIGIRIPFPASAVIQHIVDAAYLVISA